MAMKISYGYRLLRPELPIQAKLVVPTEEDLRRAERAQFWADQKDAALFGLKVAGALLVFQLIVYIPFALLLGAVQ